MIKSPCNKTLRLPPVYSTTKLLSFYFPHTFYIQQIYTLSCFPTNHLLWPDNFMQLTDCSVGPCIMG